MPRIKLRLYKQPGQAEIFMSFMGKDRLPYRTMGMIDTGASISLFPEGFLSFLTYETTDTDIIEIEQAGIAKHSFEAIEAIVTIQLEDVAGNITPPFKVRAWFANTNQVIIGFADVLDRGVLHIDMLKNVG